MNSAVFVSLLSLAALADAHHHGALHRRQNPSSASSVASSAASGASSASSPSISISLRATNPTAVPLASITSYMSLQPTIPVASPASIGAVPSVLPAAPKLPDYTKISPANYPDLDQIPSVDSPEVLQWIDEVKNSGISIPGWAPTGSGGDCTKNPDSLADPDRCWWACQGCISKDDINECDDPNHWGLTFDDGPGNYTANLLEFLDEHSLKATFFIVGSRVNTFPGVLQAEYARGHQIAVHSWSHRPLTTLTTEQVIAELGWTKKVIKDVIGVTPNQMRPPYGDIDARVRAISLAMGLTPVMWTRSPSGLVFNTQDFDIHGGTATVQQVLQNWENIIKAASTLDSGFIVLEHDLFQETVDIATGYILPDALAQNPKLTIEPVITCKGMPLANAYIETNDNSTNPPKAKLGVSSTKNGSSGGGAGGAAGAAQSLQMGARTIGSLVAGGAFLAAGLFSSMF